MNIQNFIFQRLIVDISERVPLGMLRMPVIDNVTLLRGCELDPATKKKGSKAKTKTISSHSTGPASFYQSLKALLALYLCDMTHEYCSVMYMYDVCTG